MPGEMLPLTDLNLRIDLKRLSEAAEDRGDLTLATILETALRTLDQRLREERLAAEASFPQEGRGSALVAGNIRVQGRRTSVKLEQEFWDALRDMARLHGCTVDDLCDQAMRRRRPGASLTSAIRVFLLQNTRREPLRMAAE